MRITCLFPRRAIWEYWASLLACLCWIQFSYGMPHVIRIGKLFLQHLKVALLSVIQAQDAEQMGDI